MILKKRDESFVCPVSSNLDDILRYFMEEFNDILFIQTDAVGSQLRPVFDRFFAVNRIFSFQPVSSGSKVSNSYRSVYYDCVLTIAKPSDSGIEVENTEVSNVGQFQSIIYDFLGTEFINIFRSYFECCGHTMENPLIKPVYNVNTYLPATNYTGVEITFKTKVNDR